MPRVRDFCVGELKSGEDCMVCTNQKQCIDGKRSIYCVDGETCDDQRCTAGTPTQRGSGLLISE